jgi:hydrogenase maturation protease
MGVFSKMAILVLGIGQRLRGDDGAGLAAVEYWQAAYPETAESGVVCLELAELPGLSLLELLAGSQAALIVDAVRSGGIPGTLHVLEESQLAAFMPESGSAHAWGVAETLALGRRLAPERLPGRLRLLGIEAGTVELGAGLSREVIEALPAAAEKIQEIVQVWVPPV